jgi:hypothetical protein
VVEAGAVLAGTLRERARPVSANASTRDPYTRGRGGRDGTWYAADGAWRGVHGTYRGDDDNDDDDVDLDVYEEDLRPKYNILRNKFLESDFIVRGINIKYGCKMSLFRGKEKTSLRGLHLDPRFKNNKYRLRKRYKYPRKFYEKFETIEFKNHTFRCPSPVEEFLIYVYGKNWKIPMNSDDENVYSTKEIKR